MGRRIEKRVYDWDDQAEEWEATPSLHRKFVWAGWLKLMELDGNNDPVRKYTWGLDLAGQRGAGGFSPRGGADAGGLQGAGGIGGLLAVHDESESDNYVYLYDANGNVGQLVAWASGFGGATGDEWHADRLVAHYEYDPYGGVVNQTGAYAEENPYRFSTKYWDDESGLGSWIFRYYDPRTGRWTNHDPLEEAGGLNLYGYVHNRPSNTIDPLGLDDYKIGTGPDPIIQWDNGFPYDPNAKPTSEDYLNWAKYGTLLAGAELAGHLPDGTRAYRHYRAGTGTDLWVDYNRAIREDTSISRGFHAEIEGAKADIERLHDGCTERFSVYSSSVRSVNSATENWQKAIGGHCIWGYGDVRFDLSTCEYTLTITIKMEDFYNFNKGQADITTGLPDDQNGRFEVFGWAKSFFSRAEVSRTITWKRGQAQKSTTPQMPTRRWR